MDISINAKSAKRHAGIDIGRFIAIIGVVLVHSAGAGRFLKAETNINPYQFGIDAGVIIEQLCRFAVPFFFCTSGYFLSRQNGRPLSDVLKGIAIRLVPIYCVWSLFYVLITSKRLLWLSDPLYILEWLVNGGPGFHLWFLPALGLNMALAFYLRQSCTWKMLFVVAAMLYMAGLMIGSYLPLFVPHPDPVFIIVSRDLPCFGLIFVVAGMYLAEKQLKALAVSFAVCVAGAVLHMVEATMLDKAGLMPFQMNNYLLGTLAFGVGAFMIVLHFKNLPKQLEFFAKIGRFSTGIYAVHIFFIWIAGRTIKPTELYERLTIAFFVLMLSCLTAFVVKRIKPLQFLVR